VELATAFATGGMASAAGLMSCFAASRKFQHWGPANCYLWVRSSCTDRSNAREALWFGELFHRDRLLPGGVSGGAQERFRHRYGGPGRATMRVHPVSAWVRSPSGATTSSSSHEPATAQATPTQHPSQIPQRLPRELRPRGRLGSGDAAHVRGRCQRSRGQRRVLGRLQAAPLPQEVRGPAHRAGFSFRATRAHDPPRFLNRDLCPFCAQESLSQRQADASAHELMIAPLWVVQYRRNCGHVTGPQRRGAGGDSRLRGDRFVRASPQTATARRGTRTGLGSGRSRWVAEAGRAALGSR
jgi:hypothetical protein